MILSKLAHCASIANHEREVKNNYSTEIGFGFGAKIPEISIPPELRITEF